VTAHIAALFFYLWIGMAATNFAVQAVWRRDWYDAWVRSFTHGLTLGVAAFVLWVAT
jgi:hypothetical protein